MLRLLFKTDSGISSLILRLTLGIVVFPHGAQKVLGWYGGPGMEKTIDFFTTQLHLHPVVPIIVMLTEFVGSIFLIIGFFTRLSAFATGVSMAVCAYMNHIENGFFMNWFGNQKGEGFEYHILIVGISFVLFIKGGGALSSDRFIAKK